MDFDLNPVRDAAPVEFHLPKPYDIKGNTSVWHVTWGNTAVNLNPNWHQRIAIRLASAKSRAKDAWAVLRGDKVAIDWDEY